MSLASELKDIKINLSKELDNLSVEDLETVFRYHTLQIRLNSVKNMLNIKNDGFDLILSLLNQRQDNPIKELSDRVIIDHWAKEIKEEMNSIYPKLIQVYGKLYAGSTLQVITDSMALIEKYKNMEE